METEPPKPARDLYIQQRRRESLRTQGSGMNGAHPLRTAPEITDQQSKCHEPFNSVRLSGRYTVISPPPPPPPFLGLIRMSSFGSWTRPGLIISLKVTAFSVAAIEHREVFRYFYPLLDSLQGCFLFLECDFDTPLTLGDTRAKNAFRNINP